MRTAQSRVMPAPMKTNYLGVLILISLWLVMAAVWFTRPVADVIPLARNCGEFVGVTGLYLITAGEYFTIHWARSDRIWGGDHSRARARYCVLALGALLTYIAPIIMPDPGVQSGLAGAVLGYISLILIGLTLLFTLSQEIGRRLSPDRELPFFLQIPLRPSFDLWRIAFHGIGAYTVLLFVAGGLESQVMALAPELYWMYGALGVLCVLCWLWGAYGQPMLWKGNTMLLTGVRSLSARAVELTMEPVDDRPMPVIRPGQFVQLSVPGVINGPHPFVQLSAPGREVLQVAVKVRGSDTRVLREKVGVGMTVHVRGPYGNLDIRSATQHQVWIADGMGIALFISWLRAIDALVEEKIRRSGVASTSISEIAMEEALEQIGLRQVDLWYLHHDHPAYAEELSYWEEHFPWLRVFLRSVEPVDGQTEPVSTRELLERAEERLPLTDEKGQQKKPQLSAVVCGPGQRPLTYRKELRAQGVTPVLWEDFSFR